MTTLSKCGCRRLIRWQSQCWLAFHAFESRFETPKFRAKFGWYVATETDSALRAGSHVKGTVLLVCRKRQGSLKTTRDELGWELQEGVEAQVHALIGLNQEARGLKTLDNYQEAGIEP